MNRVTGPAPYGPLTIRHEVDTMGLLFRPRRPLLRVAAGAATAGIAYNAGKRRTEQDAYNQQAAQAYDASQAAPVAAAAATDELTSLVQLHTAGQLTDQEFSAAKSKLLGL
jgi:hypothetical protein